MRSRWAELWAKWIWPGGVRDLLDAVIREEGNISRLWMGRIHMVRLALIFYGALLGGAIVLTALWGDWSTWFPHRDWLGWLQDIAGGLVLGLLIVLASQKWTYRLPGGRELTREFGQLLGPLKTWEIGILALTSGVAEEALFRATLQPWLGWVLCSILFGLLHTGHKKEFRIWTLFALFFGFLIGGIVELHPGVVLPVVTHMVVNYFNMKWIVQQRTHLMSMPPVEDSP